MDTKTLRKLLGNKIFSAQFIKKNGELRNIVARLGVSKGVKGTGKNINHDDKGLLKVYDMHKNAWRHINLKTIKEIKFRGGTKIKLSN